MASNIHVRYVGDGKQFFIGVPPRDLTKEEFDNLVPARKRDVEASSIYKFVAKSGAKDAPADAESENK